MKQNVKVPRRQERGGLPPPPGQDPPYERPTCSCVLTFTPRVSMPWQLMPPCTAKRAGKRHPPVKPTTAPPLLRAGAALPVQSRPAHPTPATCRPAAGHHPTPGHGAAWAGWRGGPGPPAPGGRPAACGAPPRFAQTATESVCSHTTKHDRVLPAGCDDVSWRMPQYFKKGHWGPLQVSLKSGGTLMDCPKAARHG